MSYQTHSKKPSLPSIQFLLQESDAEQGPQLLTSNSNSTVTASSTIALPPTTTISSTIQTENFISQQPPQLSNTANSPRRQHRHSSSINGLPTELQQLSLSAPVPNNIPSAGADERSENHQPSWMIMPSSISTTTNALTSTNNPIRRPPGATHSRSVSDYSLVNNTGITTLPAVPSILYRNRHQTHRRSVSANVTLSSDFLKILHNPSATCISNGESGSRLPYIDEQHQHNYTRAHTDSPPLLNEPSSSFYHGSLPQERLLFDALKQPQPSTLFSSSQEGNKGKRKKGQHGSTSRESPTPIQGQTSATEASKQEYENVMVARDESTGRYYCPFCNKAFNRPSSLRIHTYSHTGEKPFVCPEENCGRQFSVQSNMRRHLRVHRLGRSKTSK